MAAILPTKGNLMAAKRSRALATTGYELMDRKRNILVREMMTLMEDASRIQREIDQVFQSAYIALAKANIELGLCDRIAEGVEPDEALRGRFERLDCAVFRSGMAAYELAWRIHGLLEGRQE